MTGEKICSQKKVGTGVELAEVQRDKVVTREQILQFCEIRPVETDHVAPIEKAGILASVPDRRIIEQKSC